jgi:hypothetical protein
MPTLKGSSVRFCRALRAGWGFVPQQRTKMIFGSFSMAEGGAGYLAGANLVHICALPELFCH